MIPQRVKPQRARQSRFNIISMRAIPHPTGGFRSTQCVCLRIVQIFVHDNYFKTKNIHNTEQETQKQIDDDFDNSLEK